MIEDQRKHELRWYSERQALKQTQASRSSSAAQANSILQSLQSIGGSVVDSGDDVDPDVELANLDRKIYAAQQEMDEAMTWELKGLGVPFFGTDRSLIIPEGDGTVLDDATGLRPKHSPKVTEAQLLELRRRMVMHLEDLYRD